jgi:hypothetical protein
VVMVLEKGREVIPKRAVSNPEFPLFKVRRK